MKKSVRQQVYNKYNGLCAYTGKPLGDDWQVDHVCSKRAYFEKSYICKSMAERKEFLKQADDINNLLPACRIVNHYKRSKNLETFRRFMREFHKRLAKLPKKTKVAQTQRRKDYLYKVAELFDITVDKPFSGKFYFETVEGTITCIK
jgi:5-methylcytosine-specific restriction endonuclease McrA